MGSGAQPDHSHTTTIKALSVHHCAAQTLQDPQQHMEEGLCQESCASQRDYYVIINVSPPVVWQRGAGAHSRGESTTFTWQGLESAAGTMVLCAWPQLLDKALDQALYPMDTSPAGGSSCTSPCRAQLPSQNGLGCKGP